MRLQQSVQAKMSFQQLRLKLSTAAHLLFRIRTVQTKLFPCTIVSLAICANLSNACVCFDQGVDQMIYHG